MEQSNTVADKCITSAEFAAVSPILGRLMDDSPEDCFEVLDMIYGNSFRDFWANLPRAVRVLAEFASNPTADNAARHGVREFIDGLDRVTDILSFLEDYSHTLLDIRNLFAELSNAHDRYIKQTE